jgi:hypothetical protein
MDWLVVIQLAVDLDGYVLLVMGVFCGDDLTGSCSSTDNQGRAACQCQPRVIATLKKDQI